MVRTFAPAMMSMNMRSMRMCFVMPIFSELSVPAV